MRVRHHHTIRERHPEFAARVASRIRELRVAAGMTQAELAEGWCTKAAISAIEGGKAMPSLDALTQIADRLAVPLPTLVADEAPVQPPVSARIRAVEIDRGRVVAELIDGRIVGIPLAAVDGLLDASLRDLESWRLAPGRRAIEWPALGLVLPLDTLLGGRSANGSGEDGEPEEARGRPARRVRRAALG